MDKPLYEDPVVAEVHAIREKMLAECNGDHEKLMKKVIEHQQTSGRRIISTPISDRGAVHSISAAPIEVIKSQG
ncbi:MAG: hypothetical protein ACKVT0_17785 [Planctomycetaceae bacterium]